VSQRHFVGAPELSAGVNIKAVHKFAVPNLHRASASVGALMLSPAIRQSDQADALPLHRMPPAQPGNHR
jgi:hypothetical protein